MDAIIDAAMDLTALLSPQKVEAVATRLRSDTLGNTSSLAQLVTTPAARAALDRLTALSREQSLSGDIVAAILLSSAYTRSKVEKETSVELVWTGPTTSFVPLRRTEQVLLDLIERAKEELFLVSFVAYDVPAVADRMNAAIERNVAINVLLEASTGHGGTLSIDQIPAMKRRIPSANFYVWGQRSEQFLDGRVHAKVAVADGSIAFLTSANLTGHALEKNMEAGVVIHGGVVPSSLRAHLHALIATRIISII